MAVNEAEVLDIEKKVDEELAPDVQFEIKTETLSNSVSRVARTAAKQSPKAILTGIYFKITKDKLILRAENSDFGTTLVVPKKDNFEILYGHESEFVFQDRSFANIVRNLPRSKTKITVKDGIASIKSGSTLFKLSILDGIEFPKEQDIKDAVSVTLPSDVLTSMYQRTVFATASDESKPILAGVHHVIQGKGLTLVATNRYRLAQAYYEFKEEAAAIDVVVPAISIKELMKQLATVDKVTINAASKFASFNLGNLTIVSRLLDGKYPNTDRLIQINTFPTKIVANAGQLLGLVKRSLLMNEERPSILKIKPEDRQLRMISPDEKGKKSEFVEDLALSEQAAGADLQMGVNANYIREALEHYPAQSMINIGFVGQLKPFILAEAGVDHRNLDLILPVQIPGLKQDVEIKDFQADQQLDITKQ
jgi:DNA polymerase-3 subunit beta